MPGSLFFFSPRRAVAPPAPPKEELSTHPELPLLRATLRTARLARNQTVGLAINRLGVSLADANAIIGALGEVFPFKKARAGDQLTLEAAEDGSATRFWVRQDRADEWLCERGADGKFTARRRPVKLSTEIFRVEIAIDSSLYESIEKAGQDLTLAALASDVLAWDVDFYQDVRRGDRLRVVVERVLAEGTPLRYGDVLATEYVGEAAGAHRLFRYVDPEGKVGYYDGSGQSAQRGFLRSPLKFARITSRFGNRKHPILGYTRAHQGVDYGAPVGTPVWAVGDGVVKQAGLNGGCGKSITLRHRNGYETVYCHLSGTAVSVGRSVSQKQVIGFVGQTGLATGPHLHFMVKKAGRPVNPLTINLPRESPVRPEWMGDFKAKITPLDALLRGSSAAVD